MPSLFDARYDRGFITLMKGEPGTRKSTAAVTYPRPHYWFSGDKKMVALGLPARRFGIPLHEIEYDDYYKFSEVDKKTKSFKTICKYKTLFYDSVTSIADLILLETIKTKVSDPNQASGKKVGNIFVPGLEEFNAESSAFVELLDDMADIRNYHGINIVLIAHVIGQRKDDEKNSKTHHSRIIATGAQKTASKIAAYMTEVYHFNIKPNMNPDEEGEYTVYTTHTGNDYARTSLGLDKVIKFNDKPFYNDFIEPAIKKLTLETK